MILISELQTPNSKLLVLEVTRVCISAKHVAPHITDLLDRGILPNSIDDMRHEIFPIHGSLTNLIEEFSHLQLVSRLVYPLKVVSTVLVQSRGSSSKS